jgi:hypothetical protein
MMMMILGGGGRLRDVCEEEEEAKRAMKMARCYFRVPGRYAHWSAPPFTPDRIPDSSTVLVNTSLGMHYLFASLEYSRRCMQVCHAAKRGSPDGK